MTQTPSTATPQPSYTPCKGTYNGITIILDKASRFDFKFLLSGIVGQWFHEVCLNPETNSWNCDVRTLEYTGEFREGTRGLLLLGEDSLNKYAGRQGLEMWRGVPLLVNNRWCIASYHPQEAYDLFSSGDPSDDDDSPHKDRTPTKKSNYLFWLEKDTKKLLRVLRVGVTKLKENFHLNPPLSHIIHELRAARDQVIYLDIETHASDSLLCVGFCIGNGPVYCVPFYRYTGSLASEDLAVFLGALAISFQKNTIVCHNALFDLFYLAYFYRIPPPRKIEDTMLMQHRWYPDAEKSLAHCISLWTDEESHKDEGIFDPKNSDQERQLWLYNCRDVQITRAIHLKLLDTRDEGLLASMKQVNASVYAYLVCSLGGMLVDQQALEKTFQENVRLLIQYQRIITLLAGYKLLATSNKDVPDYLFSRMGYKPLVTTPSGAPSCNKRSLYRLALTHPNPIILFIQAYRTKKKENGMLKFPEYKRPKYE